MLVKTTLADMVEDETLKNQCRLVETIEQARDTASALRSRYESAAAAYAVYAARAVYAAVDAAVDAAAAAVYAADAAVNAAGNGDKVLSDFCERVVQILIDMKAPGCEYLYMTEK